MDILLYCYVIVCVFLVTSLHKSNVMHPVIFCTEAQLSKGTI